MGSLLQAASGIKGLLIGWIFPSLMVVSVGAAILVAGLSDDVPYVASFGNLGWAERATWTAGTSVVVGIILNVSQSALYRTLEGYTWPSSLRELMAKRKRARKASLKVKYEYARDVADDRATMNELLEKLRGFPVESRDVLPTTFGNVIKAAETYGWNRYRLDVVTFWYALLAGAPEQLRDDEARTRTTLDFQVCGLYLSIGFGVFATVAASVAGANGLEIPAYVLAPAVVAIVFYRSAIYAASEWGSSQLRV